MTDINARVRTQWRFPWKTAICFLARGTITVAFAINWEPLVRRLRYGSPVDLNVVSVVGINGDTLLLDIDGQRVQTLSSQTIKRIVFGIVSNDDPDLDELKLNGVWRTRSDPPLYTILIGDEYIRSR